MQLRNKDIRELNKQISELYSISEFFTKKDSVKKENNLIIKEKVLFFYQDEKLIPSLHLLQQKNSLLPKITIDMPAIPFIMKGADLMRPGITEFEEFEKDSYVTIIDENNKKPLAVGKSLFSSEEMKDIEKGKVVLNIHRVGDEIWNYE